MGTSRELSKVHPYNKRVSGGVYKSEDTTLTLPLLRGVSEFPLLNKEGTKADFTRKFMMMNKSLLLVSRFWKF